MQLDSSLHDVACANGKRAPMQAVLLADTKYSFCCLIAFSERAEACAGVAVPLPCTEFNSLHDAIRFKVARYRMRTHQASKPYARMCCNRGGGVHFGVQRLV